MPEPVPGASLEAAQWKAPKPGDSPPPGNSPPAAPEGAPAGTSSNTPAANEAALNGRKKPDVESPLEEPRTEGSPADISEGEELQNAPATETQQDDGGDTGSPATSDETDVNPTQTAPVTSEVASEPADAAAASDDEPQAEPAIESPDAPTDPALAEASASPSEPESPSKEPTDAEAELSSSAAEVSELIETTSGKNLEAAVARAVKLREAVPESKREEWLSRPEQAHLLPLLQLDYLSNLPKGESFTAVENGTTVDGLDLAGDGQPLQVVVDGQKVTLTRLMSRSADGTTFRCKGTKTTTNDAGEKVEVSTEEDIPVEDVVSAQIVADRDAIKEALPYRHRVTFDTFADILEAQGKGEDNPLSNKSKTDLDNHRDLAEAAKEPETTEEWIFREVHRDAKEKAHYIPTHEESTLKHYRQYDQFKELEANNRKTMEAFLGRKLTKEELLLLNMQTVKEFQTNLGEQCLWTDNLESTYLAWKSTFPNDNEGRTPTIEEADDYKRHLKFITANRADLQVIMNKDLLEEMARKLPGKGAIFMGIILAALASQELAKSVLQ